MYKLAGSPKRRDDRRRSRLYSTITRDEPASGMRAKDDSPDHMNSNRIKNSSSQIRKEAGLDRGPRNRTISDAEDLFMKSKELVLDKKEPIIVATYLLPYNIEREKSGQLVIN